MSGKTYAIERHIRTGYRGGKRADGWNVVRVSDGHHMHWSKWKDTAQDKADLLNSLQTPLTEAPDLQALRDGKAFAAIKKEA